MGDPRIEGIIFPNTSFGVVTPPIQHEWEQYDETKYHDSTTGSSFSSTPSSNLLTGNSSYYYTPELHTDPYNPRKRNIINSTTNTNTKKCISPSCNYQVKNNSKFCADCGHEQLIDIRCSECDNINLSCAPNEKFCTFCGINIQ